MVDSYEDPHMGPDLALSKSLQITPFSQLDMNGDNTVGIDDITKLIQGTFAMRDINNDGYFNQADNKILLDQISGKVN